MAGLEATFHRRQRTEKEREKQRAAATEKERVAAVKLLGGVTLAGAYDSDSDEDGEPLTLAGSGDGGGDEDDDDDVDGVALGADAFARLEGVVGIETSAINKSKKPVSLLKGQN
jgi:hypothetical protein